MVCHIQIKLNKNSGFTLVELSIVLIIIGLLVGGVIAGKSLIGAAKLRAQIVQLEDYKAAYSTFQLKYDAVPGDMSNASSLWSGVYDGNGDGMLNMESDDSDDNVNGAENRAFFWHLSESGLVKGSYDGDWGIGTGYPRLKINSGYGLNAGGSITSSGLTNWQLSAAVLNVQRTVGLHLEISDPDSGSASGFNDEAGALTVIQAYRIDDKFDDGLPYQGTIQSYRNFDGGHGQCLTGIDGDYLVNEADNQSCNMLYVLAK